jgi:hypothetical protein
MKIPLNSFEQLIDETILKRGLEYFEQGYVSEFTSIATNEYQTIVEGSEDYTVNLIIENDIVVSHFCTCPYDFGPVCKHEVAVLFYMLQNELNLSKNIPKKKKEQKKPTVEKQIKTILDALDETTLQKFFIDYCKEDKKFRNYFLVKFGHINQQLDTTFYRNQIKEIVKAASDKHGFIDWHNMKYLTRALEPLVEKLESYKISNNFQQAFFISAVLLEEMTKTIQNADDSNGDIGYFVDTAVEALHDIASSDDLDATLKKEIFEYCIQIYNKKLFSGWDWHLGILEVAEKLAKNETDVDLLISCLNKTESDYQRERAQMAILRLLHQYKTQKEVSQFIEANLSNSSIRKMEIQKAIEDKNFEYAKKLCKDGIEMDKIQKPGLAIDWYRFLLKIAQTENDSAEIIKQATYLFVNDSRSEEDYFELMRANTASEKWEADVEKLIIHIQTQSKNTWCARGLIRKIYIKQQWWNRLFELLKQTESLENIETEEEYLAKDYALELIQMYSNRLKNYVEKFMGRDHYQKACRYLRRMKKLGGETEVNRLIEHFRKTYPMRKALMDELNKV